MLQYKNDVAVARSFRHMKHLVPRFIESQIEQQFSELDTQQQLTHQDRFVYRVHEAVKPHIEVFTNEMQKYSDAILDGTAEFTPQMMKLHVQQTFAEMNVNMAKSLIVFPEYESNTLFNKRTRILLSLVNRQLDLKLLLDESVKEKEKKLQVLLEEHKLSRWNTAFNVDDFREQVLIDRIDRGCTKYLKTKLEQSPLDTNVNLEQVRKDLTIELQSLIDESFFGDELPRELDLLAHKELTQNDAFKELLSTIPKIMTYTKKRLDSKINRVIESSIQHVLEETTPNAHRSLWV